MDRDLLEFYAEREDKYSDQKFLLTLNLLSLLLTSCLVLSFAENFFQNMKSMLYDLGYWGVPLFCFLPIILIYITRLTLSEIKTLFSFSKVNVYLDLRDMEKYSFEVLLKNPCSYSSVVAKRKWLKLTEEERRKILSCLIKDEKKMVLRKRLLNLSTEDHFIRRVKKLEGAEISL